MKSDNENWVTIKSNIYNLQIECQIIFDIIYFDPPYNLLITQEVLKSVAKYLHLNSLLIIETSREILPHLLVKYDIIAIKKYGEIVISVLKLSTKQ